MGMAASQCRLMTLTSLMSNLEYKAQLLSFQKMALSRRLSDATQKYTKAISNQQLYVRKVETDGTIQTVNLTPESLVDAGLKFVFNGETIGTAGTIEDAIIEAYPNAKNFNGFGEENNILQYLLINGMATLQVGFDLTEVTPAEVSSMTQTYCTADDAVAEAEYTRVSNEIKMKEEQMDLEMDQIETQHEAAQTEYDSVKDVISKNVERTFKYFS